MSVDGSDKVDNKEDLLLDELSLESDHDLLKNLKELELVGMGEMAVNIKWHKEAGLSQEKLVQHQDG